MPREVVYVVAQLVVLAIALDGNFSIYQHGLVHELSDAAGDWLTIDEELLSAICLRFVDGNPLLYDELQCVVGLQSPADIGFVHFSSMERRKLTIKRIVASMAM